MSSENFKKLNLLEFCSKLNFLKENQRRLSAEAHLSITTRCAVHCFRQLFDRHANLYQFLLGVLAFDARQLGTDQLRIDRLV